MQRTHGIGLPGLNENFEAIYLDGLGVEQRVLDGAEVAGDPLGTLPVSTTCFGGGSW